MSFVEHAHDALHLAWLGTHGWRGRPDPATCKADPEFLKGFQRSDLNAYRQLTRRPMSAEIGIEWGVSVRQTRQFAKHDNGFTKAKEPNFPRRA
jgi:hypothetical protein